MTRNEFLNEIAPSAFKVKGEIEEGGPNSRKVYNNKLKDVNLIKRVTREKIKFDGAPIKYYPIDLQSNDENFQSIDFDNSLKDHTHLKLLAPIDMIATWTPQEYQMDLSKFGIVLPSGSDQQLYIHVDELEELLQRKPQVGDVIETVLDKTRYKVADVYFGHANLWENIFCMVTLTKVNYDTFTSQLDKFDETYKDTYTHLEEVLDIMDGTTHKKSNAKIQKQKKKTDSHTHKKPRKKSIDTALDIMTMTL